jgi:TonB family protein
MYFDFEDYRPDIQPIGGALSWREGVLLSLVVHTIAVLFLLAWPRLFPYDPEAARRAAEPFPLERIQEESPRFVYVNPRVDLEALRPPPRADASDQDRIARAPERAETPANDLPFSRGNSPERVEAEREVEDRARGRGAEPEPAEEQAEAQPPDPNQMKLPESQSAMVVPSERPIDRNARLPGGLLGDALRNLQRQVQSEQFRNLQGGGGTFGPGIQFDTKGVEFGPWLRRFVEQVKRNWEPLIPNAAAYMKGHVVLTFNIHKDGTITDLVTAAPCPIEGFNNAAYGAMRASNPTYPLPPEYPSDKAFFTVTFYYNEQPPQ